MTATISQFNTQLFLIENNFIAFITQFSLCEHLNDHGNEAQGL